MTGPTAGRGRRQPPTARPGARPAGAGRGPAPARRPPTARLGHQGVRLRSGLLGVLVLLSLIAGRLVWLQGVSARAYADQAVEQRLRTTSLLAARGAITDRNGQPLALSVDARAVYAEPRTIAKATCAAPAGSNPAATPARPCTPGALAQALAPVLGQPAVDLERKLSRPLKAGGTCSPADPGACAAFVYLARGLDPQVGTAVRQLQLVGVGVSTEPKRVHPGGTLAANVLGFTSLDDQGAITGAAGVELSANGVLAGRDGVQRAEVDGSGRVLPNGTRTEREPVPGRDVRLTIDRDLQWYAQDVLARAVQTSQADSATATVMDVRTGQILALASTPTFDANDPGAAPAADRGDRALTDVFEPGSVGKVMTMAAGLESGQVTPDSVITVPNRYQVADKVFRDAEEHPTERLTLTGVLVKSSNIGTIQVAQKVGADREHEMLSRFGIGSPSGLGLPGESRGLLPPTAQWSGATIGAVAIGQSYSVTAVQLASVYATVANDGVRVTPTIVSGTADANGVVQPAPAPASKRIVSAEVAAQLRGMLEGVTGDGGTAPLAAIPGYRVAGKTGTAERVIAGRYNGFTASFVGFAPADAPRLVVAVSVQGPKNGYFGGQVAAPPFRDVMAYALASQGVPPTGTPAPRLRLLESDPR